MTDESPTQKTSNAENVSIWWRHYDQNSDLEYNRTVEKYILYKNYLLNLGWNFPYTE